MQNLYLALNILDLSLGFESTGVYFDLMQHLLEEGEPKTELLGRSKGYFVDHKRYMV